MLIVQGHDILITTMLNGVAVIDAALLLITANIPFPQTQLWTNSCCWKYGFETYNYYSKKINIAMKDDYAIDHIVLLFLFQLN